MYFLKRSGNRSIEAIANCRITGTAILISKFYSLLFYIKRLPLIAAFLLSTVAIATLHFSLPI